MAGAGRGGVGNQTVTLLRDVGLAPALAQPFEVRRPRRRRARTHGVLMSLVAADIPDGGDVVVGPRGDLGFAGDEARESFAQFAHGGGFVVAGAGGDGVVAPGFAEREACAYGSQGSGAHAVAGPVVPLRAAVDLRSCWQGVLGGAGGSYSRLWVALRTAPNGLARALRVGGGDRPSDGHFHSLRRQPCWLPLHARSPLLLLLLCCWLLLLSDGDSRRHCDTAQ